MGWGGELSSSTFFGVVPLGYTLKGRGFDYIFIFFDKSIFIFLYFFKIFFFGVSPWGYLNNF